MNTGEQVRVSRGCLGCDEKSQEISYYQAGCVGWIVKEVSHGYHVDFEHPSNRPGTYRLNRLTGDAIWFVSTKDIGERAAA